MGLVAGTRGWGKLRGRLHTYGGTVSARPLIMDSPADHKATTQTNDRRVMAPRVSWLFEKADDVDPLQHADRSRPALVVRRHDAERSLIIEQRLAVDRVRDDDVVGREGRIQLGQ